MSQSTSMLPLPRQTPGQVLFEPLSARDLGRVGIAATMLGFGGTVIVVLSTLALGHYNSLAHCGPKAVLDGAVIALLLGRRGRWATLALLGVVYGLVLLMQVGVPYLPVVMSVAGVVAAMAGRAMDLWRRGAAILVAAAVFEWLAGFGAPIKIWFGTADGAEPVLWGLWLAEWPLRIAGACLGAVMVRTWMAGPDVQNTERVVRVADLLGTPTGRWAPSQRKAHRGGAGVRLIVSLIAATLPLAVESWTVLLAISAAMFAYACWAGAGRHLPKVLVGVVWGWAVFAGASYVWHQDPHRVVDLVRTFALRFGPIAMASATLATTTRTVDILRALRLARVPRAVLLPLAQVGRQVPGMRRQIAAGLDELRAQSRWTGPLSIVRHPRAVLRTLLWTPLRRWARLLDE